MKKNLFVLSFVFWILSCVSVVNAASVLDSNSGTIINGNSNIGAGGTGPNPSGVTSSYTSNDITQLSRTTSSSSRGCNTPTDIPGLFEYALCVLDSGVVPFLIGLGLILFLAGVVQFVAAGDNEEKRQGGRNMMIFGIISLFVMVSVWGFVNILSRSFFGGDSEIQSLPRKSSTVFKQ
jgi:hypothetical protein